jgi:hypothetical protein
VFIIETIIEPKRAAQKFSTWKSKLNQFTVIEEANINTAAFKTRLNNPKVKMIMPHEATLRRGSKVAFSRERTKAITA